MKQKIVLINIALIIALAIGFELSFDRLKLPPPIKKKKPPEYKLIVPPVKAQKPKSIIKLLVQTEEFGTLDGAKKLALENLLKSENFEIKIMEIDKSNSTNRDIDIKNDNKFMGIISSTRFASITATSPEFLPLDYMSKERQGECFQEAQVLQNAKFPPRSLEDFNQKVVGVEEKILLQAKLIFSELKSKKIFPDKIIVFNQRSNGLKQLLDEKIDYYISGANIFSNQKMEKGVGSIVDNAFVDMPGLKMIKMSDYKIPCLILYYDSKIPEDTIAEIESKLNDIIQRPESSKVINQALSLSSNFKINAEQWAKTKQKILSELFTPLHSFTKEVYLNDTNGTNVNWIDRE